jgi:hypothetical protein
MEEWVTVKKVYPTESQARKAAQVIRVTESRLSSHARGAQYDVEFEVTENSVGWQIRWRKVMADFDTECSSCGSCQSQNTGTKNEAQLGKVLQFKLKNTKENIKAKYYILTLQIYVQYHSL